MFSAFLPKYHEYVGWIPTKWLWFFGGLHLHPVARLHFLGLSTGKAMVITWLWIKNDQNLLETYGVWSFRGTSVTTSNFDFDDSVGLWLGVELWTKDETFTTTDLTSGIIKGWNIPNPTVKMEVSFSGKIIELLLVDCPLPATFGGHRTTFLWEKGHCAVEVWFTKLRIQKVRGWKFWEVPDFLPKFIQ